MFYPRFHRCPTFVRESWLRKQSQTHAVASIWWRFVSQACEDQGRYAWCAGSFPSQRPLGPRAPGLRNSHISCVVPGFSACGFKSVGGEVYGQVALGGIYGVTQHFCLCAFHLDLSHGSSSCNRSWTVGMPFVRRESLPDARARTLHVSSLSSFPAPLLTFLISTFSKFYPKGKDDRKKDLGDNDCFKPFPLHFPSAPSFNFSATRWAILNFISCEFMIALFKLFRVIFLPTLGILSLF